MNIALQPVTATNWKSLIELHVRENQKGFVASNLYSIAESQFEYELDEHGLWHLRPYGIYHENDPVGFLMVGVNLKHPLWQAFVSRLMIDDRYQGKGFGRSAMHKLIEDFRAEPKIKQVAISYEPDNDIARRLYANLGFVETGEMMEDEVLAVLNLRNTL